MIALLQDEKVGRHQYQVHRHLFHRQRQKLTQWTVTTILLLPLCRRMMTMMATMKTIPQRRIRNEKMYSMGGKSTVAKYETILLLLLRRYGCRH